MKPGSETSSIRPADIADARSILDVHRSAVLITAAFCYDSDILEAWALSLDAAAVERMAAIIAGGAELILVVVSGSRVVGFGSIVPQQNELRALYVHPNFGRAGIGGRLLSALQDLARQRQMSELTMDASLNADAFYARHGFVAVGRGEHVLRGGERMRCVRMRKALDVRLGAIPSPLAGEG